MVLAIVPMYYSPIENVVLLPPIVPYEEQQFEEHLFNIQTFTKESLIEPSIDKDEVRMT